MPAPFAIDLRSDTVTQPDDAMRAAMAAAEVGDDVLEGDPTALALEERVAELLGMEAGVFVSSGTQGNLVAQLAHGTFGRAIIAGTAMHIQNWEAGGHAVIGGAPLALVDERDDGVPDPDAVAARCAVTDNAHVPRVGLAWSENTHGGLGGLPVAPSALQAYRDAVPSGIALHNDGARLLDAAVALGVAPTALLEVADTSTLCLSKGLGCPVGTVLVGPAEFVGEAKRARKLLGSGMRQSGIIAAAGLHVLDEDGLPRTLEEIARSHELAQRLAAALAELDGARDAYDTNLPFDPAGVRTNIVRFGVAGDRTALLAALEQEGIGALQYGAGIRMVTHRRLADSDIERVVQALHDHLD